jgi:hypothetical protein
MVMTRRTTAAFSRMMGRKTDTGRTAWNRARLSLVVATCRATRADLNREFDDTSPGDDWEDPRDDPQPG